MSENNQSSETFSVSIERQSSNYKTDAVEGFYVLRDKVCQHCERGIMVFHVIGIEGQEFRQTCGYCAGRGYTTEKVLLSTALYETTATY